MSKAYNFMNDQTMTSYVNYSIAVWKEK